MLNASRHICGDNDWDAYRVNLRMDAVRRLSRETKKSEVAVALDAGYMNPSHFAQLFRRQTGLSPSDYRRQR
jgi:AraC family transcriptional regulator